MFDAFLTALPMVLTWPVILAMVVGTIGGISIGALPGLTATMGIAVLIPITFALDPLPALGMMAGIYQGAMYGGAIPAILLRIPGTPAAIATTFDGYPMAQKGEAAYALRVSLVSSALGGIASAIVLMLLSPPLARFALEFGPGEYFMLAVFGLASISVLLGDNAIKGLLSACFGLFVGVVGLDPMTGHERFTFDSMHLVSGFDIIVLLTGLYAIPPALIMGERALREGASAEILKLKATQTRLREWLKFVRIWVRASVIGIVIGIIPGAGGNVASFLSWNETKRLSKKPETFGTGVPEGVAAAECANNGDSSSALIPAITLGVPGNAVAAVILGGLLVHGMQPGPALFRENPEIIYGFMIQMLLTAFLMFLMGRFGARAFIQVLRIPPVLLATMIVPMTVIGVYSIQNSVFDIWMCLGFGIVGYAMEKLDISVAPAVLALILGPMAESNLRRVLLIGQGDVTLIFQRPISLIILVLTILVLSYPLIRRFRKSRSQRD
ncbi:MAG: tripartite tricarboxylate transporter permease [Rhodospirillales bacterium]|nr:tripartite tricarboxylate transporter permease [Rhodospirillales bacterium]